MRCRKLKRKCSGDPGNGKGCESCKFAAGPSDGCIFIRPTSWFINRERTPVDSAFPSGSVSNQSYPQVFGDRLPQTAPYHEQPDLQILQGWQTLPPLRMNPPQNATSLPTPVSTTYNSPGMSTPTQQWLSQPSYQRQLPPGFTDPVFYISQPRLLIGRDYEPADVGFNALSHHGQRAYPSPRVTSDGLVPLKGESR